MRFAFGATGDVDTLSTEIANGWFINGGMRKFVETDANAFLPYTAEGMTRTLRDCFDAAVEGRPMSP
jgi:hypothetical protein